MGVKRTKYDAVFSDLVRERAGYTCERCGHYEPEGIGRQAMHCSHFKSRSNHAVRYEPINAFCLCAACHRELGDNPDLHAEFYLKQMGQGAVDLLQEKARRIMRRRKSDMEAMYAHLKSELKRLREERKAGAGGRIEFVGFD